MATRNDKKSPNIWFRFYWNDYSNKTGHLTLLEHGAYQQLILKYMAAGKPLPQDHTRIFRMISAVTPEEQTAVTAVLQEFFYKEDGTYRSSRCDEELQRIANERQRQSELGKKGGSANSPAQAAYRERGMIATAIENDNQQSSIKTNSTIAPAIDFDVQNESQQQQQQSIIGNEQNSQNVVAVSFFLEEKHIAEVGSWGKKYREQMIDWITQHGEVFMDEAITLAKSEGFEGVTSPIAIMVTTYLPKAIGKLIAKREQAAQKKKEDEIQERAIERDIRERVAKRDAPRLVSGEVVSECDASEVFGTGN
jgi:uncharacterized protein YdaU (DUF1376 family)